MGDWTFQGWTFQGWRKWYGQDSYNIMFWTRKVSVAFRDERVEMIDWLDMMRLGQILKYGWCVIKFDFSPSFKGGVVIYYGTINLYYKIIDERRAILFRMKAWK
jgi:hypothetical protein